MHLSTNTKIVHNIYKKCTLRSNLWYTTLKCGYVMSLVQKYYKLYNKYITKHLKENVHLIHTCGKKVKTLRCGYICD
jgi:hypothetical protein